MLNPTCTPRTVIRSRGVRSLSVTSRPAAGLYDVPSTVTAKSPDAPVTGASLAEADGPPATVAIAMAAVTEAAAANRRAGRRVRRWRRWRRWDELGMGSPSRRRRRFGGEA